MTTSILLGGTNINLINRLIESDYVSKRRIQECARLLSDGQLDAPLAFRHLMPFVEPAGTLRQSLAYLASSVWIDVMFTPSAGSPETTRTAESRETRQTT